MNIAIKSTQAAVTVISCSTCMVFFSSFKKTPYAICSCKVGIMSSPSIDPCVPLVDSIADRFETLHRRYQIFLDEIPVKFQQWVRATPAQKRVFASLESVCSDLFPDLLSVSIDAPRRWILPIACVALKHWVLHYGMQGVELASCGQALRVTGSPTAAVKTPDVSAHILKETLAAALAAANRSAALEARVAHLEARAKGFLPHDPKRTKWTHALPDTSEQAFAVISEIRAEALDALAALRKTHARMRREMTELTAANEEISRLKQELERLKSDPRQSNMDDVVGEFLVLPKRALSMAGFWNLPPNDLRTVTPGFIELVEARGGDIIRRKGMTTCFLSKDKTIFVQAALEIMEKLLPEHKRAIN